MSVVSRLRRTWTTLVGADLPVASPAPTDPAADAFLEWVPPGHFYSIVPSPDDVSRAKRRQAAAGPQIPGVTLDPARLVASFAERAGVVRAWDGGSSGEGRYRAGNGAFDIGDASMLRAAILLHRPSRIVEVGSGWSSACTLDTLAEAGLDTEVTFIEPYPANLMARLRPADHERVEIIAEPLQDVATAVVESLVADDILFIDSSHVFKPGSDVDDYFARVLPAVNVGVHVHIHDIFWPFEVPGGWLDEGRAWNEGHALRNFLSGNRDWEITVFNDYFGRFHRDVIQELLPQMLDNVGGSIWLRRLAS